jgi:hypothetical protein
MASKKKYGLYSEAAAEKFGTVIYSTPTRKKIEVTCITECKHNWEKDYKWSDAKFIGQVTNFMGTGRKGSFLVECKQDEFTNYMPNPFAQCKQGKFKKLIPNKKHVFKIHKLSVNHKVKYFTDDQKPFQTQQQLKRIADLASLRLTGKRLQEFKKQLIDEQ